MNEGQIKEGYKDIRRPEKSRKEDVILHKFITSTTPDYGRATLIQPTGVIYKKL
jgi:hypothetical protein|tara:strand:+ start:141 stop:302 length:162 start_codon:yes stop_codon:yes gene_type:complete